MQKSRMVRVMYEDSRDKTSILENGDEEAARHTKSKCDNMRGEPMRGDTIGTSAWRHRIAYGTSDDEGVLDTACIHKCIHACVHTCVD